MDLGLFYFQISFISFSIQIKPSNTQQHRPSNPTRCNTMNARQATIQEELQQLQRTAAQSASQLRWTREQLE